MPLGTGEPSMGTQTLPCHLTLLMLVLELGAEDQLPMPQKESSERSLRQDPHPSAFPEAALASQDPEAVKSTGNRSLGTHGA